MPDSQTARYRLHIATVEKWKMAEIKELNSWIILASGALGHSSPHAGPRVLDHEAAL